MIQPIDVTRIQARYPVTNFPSQVDYKKELEALRGFIGQR
jgi:hypothetical protein